MTDGISTFVKARIDEDAKLIARHDTIRALREVEAKQALVDDLLAEHHVVVEDPYYTCNAASEEREGFENPRRWAPYDCDCGLGERVQRRLALLATIWDEHSDYRPEWRP